MIVRESPNARAAKHPPNWPPKSPHEAILLSPSARKKLEQQRERRRERTSVSPSPSKRRPMSRGQPAIVSEDEDEETLQLKLQAIEARLKLKKLQRARKTADEGELERPGTAASSRRVDIPRPMARSEVQVPVSPVRNRRDPEEQKSPARVLLGIDKGLRAQDVSLKRAASHLGRNVGGHSRTNSKTADGLKIKSFSERMAESRNKEKERGEKQARIERSRSGGFGLQNIEGLKERPMSRAASSLSSGTRSSQETAPEKKSLVKNRSIGNLRDAASSRSGPNLSGRLDASRTSSTTTSSSRGFGLPATAAKYAEIAQLDDSTDAPSFESFSGLHLKSREMQHNVVTRTLEGKTIVTIPQLLKTVKAPEYDPPDMENDYVVMGVIASKTSPMTTKSSVRERSVGNQEADAHATNKFMIITLTDLKWEMQLFLFDTGFSKFWKLTPGTLIAVLNPDILPPRDRSTTKFSLKLSSSDDTVLEIGTARDLDFCHAMRKDGKECAQWIDGRKTEVCEFHLQLQIEKSKRGRMEVNTMSGFGRGPRGSMFGGAVKGKGAELKREGKYHDKFLHETMYIAPGAGSAAQLLDRDELGFQGGDRAERHRKQLAEKEKERDLARRLGEIGTGTGGDYMKQHQTSTATLPTPSSSFSSNPAPASTSDDVLALLNRKATDISLAPAKRKRTMSGKSTSEPVGWAGARKPGLLLSPPKKGGHPSSMRTAGREPSPAKKKARLVVPEKGVRVPGRESLDVGLLAAMDDEDDDLEVV